LSVLDVMSKAIIKNSIKRFLSHRTMAVAGASDHAEKFGYMAYRELKTRGFTLYPVHPSNITINGDRCYASVDDIPGSTESLLVILPPVRAEAMMKNLDARKIRLVWLQQGAESPGAVRICREKGIDVIAGECILMHAPPVRSYHLLHRWWRLATCAMISR
jgi:uncharacterized protein